VAAQVALSVVLLTGSGLLIRSFVQLQAEDLGFRTENLMVAKLSAEPLKYEDPEAMNQFFQGVLDDVRAMPQVVSASMVDKVPIRHPWTNWEVWDSNNPPDESRRASLAFARFVAPSYFDVMGVPILQGRGHERQDVDNALPPVVVNQALAEALFPEEDPVGRRLSVNFIMAEVREYEIVGVAGDMRITAVSQSPPFQMYFDFARAHPMPTNSRHLMVRTQGDLASLVSGIRRKALARDPDAPLTEVSTMTDVVYASLTGNRVLGLATALFAVTALLLSMTGLYAVLAYYVSRRTREIGIRLAFGATGVHVMRSVLGRGLVLVMGGLGLGFLGAFGVTRLLQAQLYQVGATDPFTFVSVGAGLLVIGALASLLPARRATRVDPVRAMQVE
jgi:predicted permease